MVLRLVTGVAGALMLFSTVATARGHGTFTQQLADGRMVQREPALIERCDREVGRRTDVGPAAFRDQPVTPDASPV